jgi:hypothetical protein
MCKKFFFYTGDGHLEICAGFVHLVYKTDGWQIIFLALPPDRFALCLDAFGGVKDGDGRIENSQRALDLGSEINVAGSIDKIDNPLVPLKGRRGTCNGNASLLFFFEIVHNSGAIVDFAHFVCFACIIEDSLGKRGLAGVDMGHYSYVSNFI